MLWIQKIKQRREVIFNEEDMHTDELVVPTLEIEESSSALKLDMWDSQERIQSEAFAKALVELTIPRAVYRNAVKSTKL